MTLEEAKRLLHPDTTAAAIAEIKFYAGFSAEEAKLRAVNDACRVACDAIDKLLRLEEWMDDLR